MTETPHDPTDADAHGQPPAPEATAPTKDERNLAMLSHLLGIVLGVIGPLIIWLIKKDESPFVDDQGKEALNFQITVLIAMAGVTVIAIITCGFGALLAPPVMVVDLVFCIIAALKASGGQHYRYPITTRLIT